jgi:hypothetical protein
MNRFLRCAVLVMFTLGAVARAESASGPVFSDAGPDAEAYGAAKGFPVPPVGQPATHRMAVAGSVEQ